MIMRKLKEVLEARLNEYNELYNFYLGKLEDKAYESTISISEQRIHDYRIKINEIEDILDIINESEVK